MENTKVIATFAYHHGCTLLIDGARVVEDIDEEFGDIDTGEFDHEGVLSFLRENDVSHVVDSEFDYGGVFGKDIDYEWPIDDYIAARRQLSME